MKVSGARCKEKVSIFEAILDSVVKRNFYRRLNSFIFKKVFSARCVNVKSSSKEDEFTTIRGEIFLLIIGATAKAA